MTNKPETEPADTDPAEEAPAIAASNGGTTSELAIEPPTENELDEDEEPAMAPEPEPSEEEKAPEPPPGPPVMLAYQGNDAGEPHIGGVPAVDLREPDIERLVYARTVDNQVGTPGLAPKQKGYKAARKQLIDELVASAVYEEA